jgi:hypothetical protein
MRLERIANGAPRLFVHRDAAIRQQIQEDLCFSDSNRNCKNLLVAVKKVLGVLKNLAYSFQTTVSRATHPRERKRHYYASLLVGP